MEHDDPNGKWVLPHGNGELVWKFTKRGKFEFACLIPGRYEKGMFGQIIRVTARAAIRVRWHKQLFSYEWLK